MHKPPELANLQQPREQAVIASGHVGMVVGRSREQLHGVLVEFLAD